MHRNGLVMRMASAHLLQALLTGLLRPRQPLAPDRLQHRLLNRWLPYSRSCVPCSRQVALELTVLQLEDLSILAMAVLLLGQR